jgi:hypothetical protein
MAWRENLEQSIEMNARLVRPETGRSLYIVQIRLSLIDSPSRLGSLHHL